MFHDCTGEKKNMLMPSLANTLVRNRSFSNLYPGDQETFFLRPQTFTMMCVGIWCFWAIAQYKTVKNSLTLWDILSFPLCGFQNPEAPDFKIFLLFYIGLSGFIQNNGIFLTHKISPFTAVPIVDTVNYVLAISLQTSSVH